MNSNHTIYIYFIDNQKADKKRKKLIFKDDKLEFSIFLTKSSELSFIRKNITFKVLIKDKKNRGTVIAQSVCNISDYVYMPSRGKHTFDQKVSLKFHKGMSKVQ